jgi:adenylate cyclase
LFERPAVAVLPFENLSGDADQEYFADGLTEDIITALSLWRSFPVIARNSTFAYKGLSADIRSVGEELRAQYVVEGSVRKSGVRVRVTAQLIESNSGHHVWAEKFDRDLVDIFELQDEISLRIAAAVSPELERNEQKRLAASQPRDLDAWDCVQRGMSRFYDLTKEGIEAARDLFRQALELDPNYAEAFAAIADSHAADLTLGHLESRDEAQSALMNAARKAVTLDPTHSTAQLMLSFAYAWTDQEDLAITTAEKAIELNPSNALGYSHLGTVLDLSGRHDEGIARLEQSLRLNPNEPFRTHVHLTFLARALMTVRRYEDAVASARKAISLRAVYPPAQYLLAVSLGHLGRCSEARAELEKIEREQPEFIKKRTEWRPYRNQADNEHILDGLRKAGWEG